MKTVLIYKFDDPVSVNEIEASLVRVKHHYYQQHKINFQVSGDGWTDPQLGVFIWDDADSPLRWPSWSENDVVGIATVNPPVNWEDICETSNIDEAPFRLVEKLGTHSTFISTLSPPFVLSAYERNQKKITIFTDAIGVGRLYELRTDRGWVWSNRLGALPIFAGIEPQIDQNAWSIFAGTGWFMGQTTPLQGVRRVKPSTKITIDASSNKPRIVEQLGALSEYVSPRGIKDPNIEEIADNIKKCIKSFSTLWGVPLEVDLSGGKDSRVGAAAILASHLDDIRFKTIGTLQGEVDIAKALMEGVNQSDKHIVTERIDPSLSSSLLERVLVLHHEFDGDYTPITMNHAVDPDTHFSTREFVSIQGAGGEIAHGNYYASQRWLDKILSMGENGPSTRITNYLSVLGCVPPQVHNLVHQQVYEVFSEAKDLGISGLSQLDYFYLVERFRRWAPIGGHVDRYSPFLAPSFLRAAYDLQPEQRLENSLHTQLIESMVPEWKDVPFFKASPKDVDERTLKKKRMWQTGDKDLVEEILAQPATWNDVFVVEDVVELWNQAKTAGIPNSKAALFQRVIWRAVFEEHVEGLRKSAKR
jgi:hypothetical protein